MHTTRGVIVKDLVLVGGGHSHVTVIKRFGMRTMPGVRLTVIAREIHTPYSGMLPGLIAGHYTFDEAHIDLEPLARFADARLFHDEVVGLDLARRLVLCRNRPPVGFDILSINIGSTPSLGIAGAAGRVVPVKPISSFMERWERLTARVLASTAPARIGVVGAGAGGVELTLAVQFALGRLLAARGRAAAPDMHLFSATPTILPTHNRRVRAKFARVLRERGVHVHLGAPVVGVEPGRVRAGDGRVVELDEVLWTTEAAAQPWLAASGLAVDERGFVCVDDTLQSTSHPGVFAAGDIAAVVKHPREKSGVFAVRQGPPLEGNLRRALQGRRLKPFRPQMRVLSLITTGDRYAIASRSWWSLEGRYVWVWKNWIDRRFMTRFGALPAMPMPPQPALAASDGSDAVRLAISAVPMRCGGCGSKIGATVLERVLSRLQPIRSDEVALGLECPDDAAVERVPADKLAVRTVDAFRAIVDDPYVFGKITANHCLSDIYAMGGEPRTALAIATVPYGLEAKVEDTLEQLLTGVVDVLNAADTALTGGHSTEGSELALGLAVSGVIDPGKVWRKSGLRPGDRLILTKPLGTGTLFAADMRLKAKGRWIAGAIESMLQSNRQAAECLGRYGVRGCTDVTGFGVLGHLVEMTRASSVAARLSLCALPVLDGARETVAAGLLSSLQPENIRLRRAIANLDAVAGDSLYPLLFDPQTSGGLLASVPPDRAEACLADLRALGYHQAAIVGSVEERDDRSSSIWIDR